jgi:hypothetical protein
MVAGREFQGFGWVIAAGSWLDKRMNCSCTYTYLPPTYTDPDYQHIHVT